MPLFSSVIHHIEVHKWHSCNHKGYRHWFGSCPETGTCKRMGFSRNHVRFVHHHRYCKNCRYQQLRRSEIQGGPVDGPADPRGDEDAEYESENGMTASEAGMAAAPGHRSNHGAGAADSTGWGSNHGSNHRSNHGPPQGPNSGRNRGPEPGPEPGPDRGPNHGSNRGTNR